MSQGSFNPKIRFQGQKVCSVSHVHTDRHTNRHRHTHRKVTTVGTISGIQEFFLQPIIKDRPNIVDIIGVVGSNYAVVQWTNLYKQNEG